MVRKQGPTLVLLAGLLVGGSQLGVAHQDSPPGVPPLTEEIGRLNRSLDDIARSLRELLHGQKIQLIIRRIELEERRLAPLGGELRGTRAEVRSHQDEIARMEGYMEQLRDHVEESSRSGTDQASAPAREELGQVERMVELEREQLKTSEARVIELENDVARGRDNIAILDDLLQELLEASSD